MGTHEKIIIFTQYFHFFNYNSAESLDNFGVLLLWDCSMPHMKNIYDEIIKEQAPYR